MAEALAVSRPAPRKSRVLLPGQPVAGGRYSVARPLGLSARWGRYLLRRRDDGSHWRLDVLEGTGDALSLALDRMACWVHPGLVRVHEHFVEDGRHFVVTAGIEGHNLETAVRWSEQRLERDRVIDWGTSLCRTLQFLYEGDLLPAAVGIAATGVVVTPDDRLVLRDLDYSALLGGGPRDGRLAGAMRSFADLLGFMAGGQELPPDLAWVVARCRSGEPERAYRSFRELEETLEGLRHPDAAPQAAPVGPQAPETSSYRPPDLPRLAPPTWLVATVLGLLALGGLFLAASSRPSLPPRTGAALYFTSGSSLFGLDAASGDVLGHVDLGHRLGAAAASRDGRRLFVAEPDGPGLTVVDTIRNEVVGALKLGGGAGELRLDPAGRSLFVLQPAAGRLARVALDATAPGSVAGARLDGILATAPEPRTFALLPAEGSLRAAVAAADGSLTLSSLDPPATLATVTPGALTALVPSRDGRLLYAVGAGSVLLFDGATLQSRGRLSDLGGKEPLQAFPSRDGKELWVLHREGTVGVVNLADGTLRSTIPLGGPARLAVPGPAEGPQTLWVALTTGELAVVEPARRAVLNTRPAPQMMGGAAVSAPQPAE